MTHLNRPFDKQPNGFTTHLGALIKVVEEITATKVVPNEQVAKVSKFPFVTYYPLMFDDPVFGDPTHNDGLFEAVVSWDVFAKTMSESIRIAGDLQIYLLDLYTRQLLRRDAQITIREATNPQTRSVRDLPFTDVHHTGFDLTFQYYRNFRSPIDTIESVEDLGVSPYNINDSKEEQ